MDVLLVNAPVKMASKHSSLTPPLGLSYIASVLLKSGYDVSAVDFNISGSDTSSMKRVLERESPSILGISAHTESYLGGLEIADIAKQINPETVVVMGGPHATILYDQTAREKSIDFVVIGEGEYTMLELAHALIGKQNSLAEIRGIAYKEGGEVRVTPERPFIEDPDELPFPARELFPLPLYESGGNVLMSRGGCPFKCHFCAVNNIWKGKRRFRRPDKTVYTGEFTISFWVSDIGVVSGQDTILLEFQDATKTANFTLVAKDSTTLAITEGVGAVTVDALTGETGPANGFHQIVLVRTTGSDVRVYQNNEFKGTLTFVGSFGGGYIQVGQVA